MKSYTLLFLFFTLFVGAQTPISKSLGEFSELKIYDLINVELIESTENKIEISGDNATDLNVVQKNDVLKIRMALHKSLNGKNTFVKLFYTKIHTIDVNEGAKVTSESPFKQYELELKAQEGGTPPTSFLPSFLSLFLHFLPSFTSFLPSSSTLPSLFSEEGRKERTKRERKEERKGVYSVRKKEGQGTKEGRKAMNTRPPLNIPTPTPTPAPVCHCFAICRLMIGHIRLIDGLIRFSI